MTGEDYVPRPNGRFVSFKDQPGGPPPAPYTWPQDTLTVPTGYGALPLVDNLNANLARREFFGISTQWLEVPFGSVLVNNVPVPKDGDFWCSNICTMATNDAGGTITPVPNPGPIAYLQIEDGNNGYPLMSAYVDDYGDLINGAPWGAFASKVALGSPSGGSLKSYGAGSRTALLQPYCFLRGGSIRLTLTVPPLGGAFPPTASVLNWYVSLAGWKEYAYAAA